MENVTDLAALDYNKRYKHGCPRGYGIKEIVKYHGKDDIICCLNPAVEYDDNFSAKRESKINFSKNMDRLKEGCSAKCVWLKNELATQKRGRARRMNRFDESVQSYEGTGYLFSQDKF